MLLHSLTLHVFKKEITIMALLKPRTKSKKVTVKAKVDSEVLCDLELYKDYAGFKKNEDVIEAAIIHILTEDKDFKDWKKAKNEAWNLA